MNNKQRRNTPYDAVNAIEAYRLGSDTDGLSKDVETAVEGDLVIELGAGHGPETIYNRLFTHRRMSRAEPQAYMRTKTHHSINGLDTATSLDVGLTGADPCVRASGINNHSI